MASAEPVSMQALPTEPIPPKSMNVKTDKPRPYICAMCTRGFARMEHLKRHERSHTKERPFKCPVCNRGFARRDLLLRHKQKLHASFSPPKSEDGSDGQQTPAAQLSPAVKNGVTLSIVSGRRRSTASPLRVSSLSPRDRAVSSLPLNPFEREIDSLRGSGSPYSVSNKELRSASFSAGVNPEATRHAFSNRHQSESQLFDSAYAPFNAGDVQFATPQPYSESGDVPHVVDFSRHRTGISKSVPANGLDVNTFSSLHGSIEGDDRFNNSTTINPQLLRSCSQDSNLEQVPELTTPSHPTPGVQSVATPSSVPRFGPGFGFKRDSFSAVNYANGRHRSFSTPGDNGEALDSPAYSVPSVASVFNWDSPMAHAPASVGSSYTISSPEGSQAFQSRRHQSSLHALHSTHFATHGGGNLDDAVFSENSAQQKDEFRLNDFVNIDHRGFEENEPHVEAIDPLAEFTVAGDGVQDTQISSQFENWDFDFHDAAGSLGPAISQSMYHGGGQSSSGVGLTHSHLPESVYSESNYLQPLRPYTGHSGADDLTVDPFQEPTDPLRGFSDSHRFTMPSEQQTRRFVASYHQSVGRRYGLVHRSLQPDGHNVGLMASMAALGALFMSETPMAARFHSVASDVLSYSPAFRANTSLEKISVPLWLVQAVVVAGYYSIFNDKLDRNHSSIPHLQRLVPVAKAARLQVPPQRIIPPINWASATILERWNYFIECQSRIRTMHAVHALVLASKTLFGLNVMDPISLNNILTCGSPCEDDLWDAQTPEVWWSLVQSRGFDHDPDTLCGGLDFMGCIRRLEQGQPLGERVPPTALYAMLGYISAQTFTVTHKNPESLKSLRNSIHAWERTYARYQRSDIENSPILEDCISRRAILMIRLHVDMSPAKELFWQRDFHGMNHYLDQQKNTNADGLVEASLQSLDVLLLGEMQVKKSGRIYFQTLNALYNCVHVLYEALEAIEALPQPKEKHQELLMRAHKIFTRLQESEPGLNGGVFDNEPSESLGHLAVRLVHSMIRRAVSWPVSALFLRSLETRI